MGSTAVLRFLIYLIERRGIAIIAIFFVILVSSPSYLLSCNGSFEKQTAQLSKLIYLASLMLECAFCFKVANEGMSLIFK